MKILEFGIKHFRSIENILLKFPTNKPMVLFGPNNAGKTNILTALNIALGESFPTYREMDESDYFFRDKDKYSEISFYCCFDGTYYIISPAPKMPVPKLIFQVSIPLKDYHCTLTLEISHKTRYRFIRGYGNQHMYMVWHCVSFYYLNALSPA